MLTRRSIMLGAAAVGAQATAAPTPWATEIKPALDAVAGEGRYLPLYGLARSGKAGRDLTGQWSALVGDETLAFSGRTPPKDIAPDLAGANAEKALSAIATAARDRRVVVLNEAHNASRHRSFLAGLLRALRPLGFTHLAAETFANDPGDPQVSDLRSGVRIQPQHGFYLWDPVFAEAVREGLDLGYRLAAYEARLDQQHASTDPKLRAPVREQAQADNLAELLERWPQSRFVVHVGVGHISETNTGEAGPMFAERLKARTGIDPLTIGQAWAGSFGPHGLDDNTCAAVLERFRPKAPIVVRRSDGAPLERTPHGVDMALYHPSLPIATDAPAGWRRIRRGDGGPSISRRRSAASPSPRRSTPATPIRRSQPTSMSSPRAHAA